MNIFCISIRNIKAKPLTATLSIVLFATGVFIISFLLLAKDQLTTHLEKNVAGINMVAGAKGSPLQLILSTIYHVDYPTGNISYDEARRLGKNPLVARTVPIALGDNYKGYRIVGTTADYAALYGGTLQTGTLWAADFEVTIGAKTAEITGLKVGDRFAGVHGFIETDHIHGEHRYTVTGIFERTGTVLDQVILTNISSVWRIHEHGGDEEHEEGEETVHLQDEQDREITALLVFYRNAMGAISLPRYVNRNTNMQAASPAIELNRLFSLMGASIQTIGLIAYLIIFISGLSIFVSLFHAMKERKYELALIRVMGGSKLRIFALVVTEGLTIAVTGFFIGTVLSKAAAFGVSWYTEGTFHYGMDTLGSLKDFVLLAGSLLIGLLASFLPAIKAMKTDISKTLSR
ncbi:MAG: FtsX-like permease family protein [Bacteroidales bacterium]|jgi:putative ABC transport system permease protein|nr:FtsX-like permease family protein [Bacteroidales bacterium]